MFDLHALLLPVAPDAPCGPDMQYASEFAAIERAMAGKPERQVGKSVTPAESPDWSDVESRCYDLLLRSKDLRLAGFLARALTEKHGFRGFADATALIRGLVDRYWPHLHPALDRDEDNDPTERLNAVAVLNHHETLVALRSAPIVVSKTAGVIALRALDATRQSTSSATIEAAIAQASADDWRVSVEVLERCASDVDALRESLARLVGSRAPEFAELRTLLAQVRRLARAQQRPTATSLASVDAGDHRDEPPPTGAAVRPHAVESRDDVLRSFDDVCAYYARVEPSSPVPLLLQRCRRLIPLSFADALKELVPESLAALQKITGKTDA